MTVTKTLLTVYGPIFGKINMLTATLSALRIQAARGQKTSVLQDSLTPSGKEMKQKHKIFFNGFYLLEYLHSIHIALSFLNCTQISQKSRQCLSAASTKWERQSIPQKV